MSKVGDKSGDVAIQQFVTNSGDYGEDNQMEIRRLIWIGERRGAFGSWVKQPRQLELTFFRAVQALLVPTSSSQGGSQRGRISCDVSIFTQDQRKHPFSRSHPWPYPCRGNNEEWKSLLLPKR